MTSKWVISATLSLVSTSSTLLTASTPPAAFQKGNYPSNFQVDHGWNLFLIGEYLYWVAQEDGLYYAQTGKASGTTQLPSMGHGINFKGQIKKIEPSWESAFRVGAGINFPHSGYDLLVLWTHYHSSAQETTHAKNGSLLPLWGHPDNPNANAATMAQGRWNLNFNLCDLEWGRSSWFGEHFSFRLLFGVRALFTDQTLTNHYLYATTPATSGKLHLNSDFQGGGIRIGADTRYTFPHDFFLYGTISGALLYGNICTQFSLKEDSKWIGKSNSDDSTGITTLQLALGLGWDTHFAKDRCHLALYMGWEQNGLFNVNQMQHYLSQLSQGSYFKERGTLTLQGLVAGGRFSF